MITYSGINLTNKKIYFGSTKDFDARYKKHAKGNSDLEFHRSLKKNPENFYWIIGDDDGSEGREEEQYYLDFYLGTVWCYNIRPTAESGGDTCSNTFWWNNGVEDTRSAECPGEGWVLGRLEVSENFTASWWNNGVESKRSVIRPGKGWEEGHLHGRDQSGSLNGNFGKTHPNLFWWNDGTKNTRSAECPGEGWVRGPLKRSK